MIKGAKKQMIVVRTGDSKFYDEAYFVLRREVNPDFESGKELLEEANRIVSEKELQSKGKGKTGKRSATPFLAGAIFGILLGIFVAFLLRKL